MTAEDLYNLFADACKNNNAPGYAGDYKNQSRSIHNAFEAFRMQLQRFGLPSAATDLVLERHTDDTIRRFCDVHNKKTLQALYNHMNALGFRVNYR